MPDARAPFHVSAICVEIAKLALRPGDLVVVMTREALQVGQAAWMMEDLRGALPAGVKAVLLDKDCGIAVLAPDQVDPAKVAAVAAAETALSLQVFRAGEDIRAGQLLDHPVNWEVFHRPNNIGQGRAWGTAAMVIKKGESVESPTRDGWVYARSQSPQSLPLRRSKP